MFEQVDPEEFCVNCHAKISGRYRRCEFCGKVWDQIDDGETRTENAQEGDKG